MKIKIDRCPFCGSDRGFDMHIETVKKYLGYDFSGQITDSRDEIELCFEEPAYCINCGKPLSKKYIEIE